MNKLKLFKDSIVMAVIIVASILTYNIVIPAQIPDTTGGISSVGAIGSRDFPQLVVGLIGIIAGIELIKNLFKAFKALKKMKAENAETSENDAVKPDKKEIIKKYLKVLIMFILYAVYGFLFVKFGFIIPTIFVIPLILFVVGSRNWKHYVSIYVFAAIIYVIFKYVLYFNI